MIVITQHATEHSSNVSYGQGSSRLGFHVLSLNEKRPVQRRALEAEFDMFPSRKTLDT